MKIFVVCRRSKSTGRLRLAGLAFRLDSYYLPRAAAFEALSGFLVPSPERDDLSAFS